MKKNKRAVLMWGMTTLLFALIILPGISLINATLVLTEHGVYKRLSLPIWPLGQIEIPIYSGSAGEVQIPNFLDGPVITPKANGTWHARWFCQDHLEERIINQPQLDIICGNKQHAFLLGDMSMPEAVMPQANDKVMVLSDLEGNADFLQAALGRLAIINSQGNWAYGNGRLIIVGDSVDRGRDVFALLWQLYHLSQQAKAAGGAVHVLLGNHEQYILRGNFSRAHNEHIFAVKKMGGFADAFGAQTLLGAWLRQQPVVAQVGRVLFTHGGISPVLAQQHWTPARLNATMANYWQGKQLSATELEAVLGTIGVTQYRGYFLSVEDQYPQAKQADVEHILQVFGADHIVVGHTVVNKVEFLFQGKVIAVDVNSNEAAQQVLSWENRVSQVTDIGIPRNLPLNDREVERSRPFNLYDSADRQLLSEMYDGFMELSRIRIPY